jgi:hypothetical protein
VEGEERKASVVVTVCENRRKSRGVGVVGG